ncbi:MAG: AtpZ/AtpI family protein [Planctomycetota bacterium]|nr:AtpZ/AtpI family protein [Planctomycetota bacterium]
MAKAEDEDRPDERRVDGPEQRQMEQWYRLAGIGMEFVVAVLLFGGIGWWADGRVGTQPWLMLGGGLLGFGVGLWLMLKAALGSFHD